MRKIVAGAAAGLLVAIAGSTAAAAFPAGEPRWPEARRPAAGVLLVRHWRHWHRHPRWFWPQLVIAPAPEMLAALPQGDSPPLPEAPSVPPGSTRWVDPGATR